MSNFACDHCGANICDSPHGYVTGCEHYPTEEEDCAYNNIPVKPVRSVNVQAHRKDEAASVSDGVVMDIKIVPLRELLSEIIYNHADPDNPDYNECDIDLCGWCWSAKAHLAEMPTDKKSLTVQGDEP